MSGIDYQPPRHPVTGEVNIETYDQFWDFVNYFLSVPDPAFARPIIAELWAVIETSADSDEGSRQFLETFAPLARDFLQAGLNESALDVTWRNTPVRISTMASFQPKIMFCAFLLLPATAFGDQPKPSRTLPNSPVVHSKQIENRAATYGQLIPLFAALGGAITTLAGVLIVNYGNSRRLLIQLGHDASEKAKDRQAAITKDVYLGLASELVNAGKVLGAIGSADFTKEQPGLTLHGLSIATNQLVLVASVRTAMLASELLVSYSGALTRLLIKIMPTGSKRADAQIASDLYEQCNAEIIRTLAERRAILESGVFDDARFKALTKTLEFEQNRTNDFREQRDLASREANRLMAGFFTDLQLESEKLEDIQLKVLISIREDLGGTVDLGAFEKQIQVNRRRIKDTLSEFQIKLTESFEDSEEA